MRFMAICGCLIAAIDCMERAMGLEPSVLFAPDFAWVFWLFAAGWIWGAFRMLSWRGE
jgi:hypothetical protein